MKRLIAFFLMVLAAVQLTGCSTIETLSGGSTPPPEEITEEAADVPPTPAPTPVPTPSPTPVPAVDIADYQYERIVNKTLGISFSHPTHWLNMPGKITISFMQPVNAGEIAARVAISVKKASKSLDAEGLKSEHEKLIGTLTEQFENFQGETISKKTKFLGNTAASSYYTAELDGQKIRGFVITGYKKSKKRLVALHFYAPADQFDAFEPVLKKIQGSVKFP